MMRGLTSTILLTTAVFATASYCRATEATYTDVVAAIEEQNAYLAQLTAQKNVVQLPDCCSSGGCCPTPCAPCAGWTVTADALFLERSSPDAQILATPQGGPANVINFKANQFDLDWAVGPRVSITRHTRTGCDFEFTYFGIDGWYDSAFVPGANQMPLNGINFGLGGAGVTFEYASKLYNMELNIASPQTETFTIFAGFRWIELNERFAASIPGIPNVYTAETDNHLYGLQIGGIVTPIQSERFLVEARCAGGAYHNNMHANVNIFATTPGGSDQDHTLAFVGDLSLTGVLQIFDRLALRFGYQILIIDSVAVATDQPSANNSVTRRQDVVDSGSLLYHGGICGLESSW